MFRSRDSMESGPTSTVIARAFHGRVPYPPGSGSFATGGTERPDPAGPHAANPGARDRPGIPQTISGRVWQGTGPGVSLNARETCRDAAPALGKTAEATVSMGYPDRVRQARVFPGPPGSRPARSLIYTHGGDLYKATIGRPRKRYGPPSARSAVADGRAEGQESGNKVIAIVVTDRMIEIWSQEPS